MATIAEQIYEVVKTLPERQAAEVLDFAEQAKARHPAQPPMVADGDREALCAELQALAESQPMQAESAGEFIGRMRGGARQAPQLPRLGFAGRKPGNLSPGWCGTFLKG